MNRRKIAQGVVGIALCVAASTAEAATVVVDFENYNTTQVATPVQSQGFTFAPAGGALAVAANGTSCSPTCARNGTVAIAVGAPDLTPNTVHPITMTNDAGLAFFLTGLDFAELSESAASGFSADSIVMTGHLLGGGTITQTLAVDGINDGAGLGVDFQTAVLDAGWATSLLISLEFAGFIGPNDNNEAFQLDNIALDVVLEPVPEPGTLALMGLAVLGVVTGRRKRR